MATAASSSCILGLLSWTSPRPSCCNSRRLRFPPPPPLPHHSFSAPLRQSPRRVLFFSSPPLHDAAGGGGGGGGGSRSNNNNNNGGWGGDSWYPFDDDGWGSHPLFLLSLLFSCAMCIPLAAAAAAAAASSQLWEVRGGTWTRLVPDPSSEATGFRFPFGFQSCRDLFFMLMLPEGYPHSVTPDYLEYSLWRGVQGVASQVSAVLSTQALLYAIGLGRGAIPTAAAINWVLKDGIGYLSKILLSKFGRHFDVNPKGWRLFADFLENGAYGLEILTPAFPQFFVMIGAAAGAGRSAAALIQAATRSCFYAGFAAQRNFAEVIAKGEAQGMVSKFLGIILGIALANSIGSSIPLALASFGVVTVAHMYCNLKSYQSIQLRTLNPYRASLVFSEYLLSGQVPSVKEVNDEEPFFPDLTIVSISAHKGPFEILSAEAKEAAATICRRVQLGSNLSEVVRSEEDVVALCELYKNERYILTESRGRYHVILKEESTPQDMLRSLFHVNYLYWLERNVGIEPVSAADECKVGGRLQISLDYVQREFIHIKHDGSECGWLTEGLIARPLSNRIRIGDCYDGPNY